MNRKGPLVFTCALVMSFGVLRVPASSRQATSSRPALPARADSFDATLKPFLKSYCYGCHSGSQPAAGLDLTSYGSQESIVADQHRWNLVLARLRAGEMPPSQSRQQPSAAERQSFIDLIDAINAEDARRHPNDPGMVLARRLSNAEYDYTIHDLTGVDIRPTKEFPVDPANQAGFDNSGESLAMSPALVKKYLDAARVVADHVLFMPSGFTFAPSPVVTDQDRRFLQAPAARLRGLLPCRLAVSPPRGTSSAEDDAGGCGGGGEGQRHLSDPAVDDVERDGRRRRSACGTPGALAKPAAA
jgi:hypothetical protein